jgi:hypothetical protein
VVQCDWCKEQINDVEDGNVYWLHNEPSLLYFNHKHCAHAHDQNLEEIARARDTLVFSEHLEVFLAQLLGNTGRVDAMPIIDRERLYETRG